MEKQDLYTFDDTNINFNTSELDDIISSDDILKNFKDESTDKLTFSESEVKMLKEETVEKEVQQEQLEEKPVMSEEESILFSDEADAEVYKSDDGLIVEDKETEAFVQEKINETAKQYSHAGTESIKDEQQSFFEEDVDETISLSGDELSNILEDTEELEAAVPTLDSVMKTKELKEELPPEVSEEIDLSELPEEELEVSDLPIEEIEEPLMQDQSEIGKDVSSFFEEDEDESIGLTGNELDNILKATEIVEDAKVEEFVAEGLGEENVFDSLSSEIIE